MKKPYYCVSIAVELCNVLALVQETAGCMVYRVCHYKNLQINLLYEQVSQLSGQICNCKKWSNLQFAIANRIAKS